MVFFHLPWLDKSNENDDFDVESWILLIRNVIKNYVQLFMNENVRYFVEFSLFEILINTV